MVESVNRNYHRRIKEELDRLGLDDINAVQASLLFHIGEEKIEVGQVRSRGNYLGLNTSYIIKSLVENQYLCHERSSYDSRVRQVWVTDKGRWLSACLRDMHDRDIAVPGGGETDLDHDLWTLRQIEQFWIDQELDHS